MLTRTKVPEFNWSTVSTTLGGNIYKLYYIVQEIKAANPNIKKANLQSESTATFPASTVNLDTVIY